MTGGPILVLAADPDRLRPSLAPLTNEQVVFVDDLGRAAEALKTHSPEIVLMYRDTGFDGPQFRTAAQTASVRWVHVCGSGYEYLEPLHRTDLTLTNGQGLRSRYLAETAVGALIALNHGLLAYREQQRQRLWRPRNFRPLRGQTLLVVGTGSVGTCLARNARALGMRVIGANRQGHLGDGLDEALRLEAIDDALPDADVVSVHLRATAETEGFFDARRFALMKPGAMFLNTARGALVVEQALVDALTDGGLGSAYLDVFATEPLPPTSPLWDMDNVLLTPHAADCIVDWDVHAARLFLSNLVCWRGGLPLQNIVRAPAG